MPQLHVWKKNCSSEVTTFVIYDHTVTSISFSKLKTATEYVLTSTIRCNIFYYAKVKYHYCLMPKLQSWIIQGFENKKSNFFFRGHLFCSCANKKYSFFLKKKKKFELVKILKRETIWLTIFRKVLHNHTGKFIILQ